MFITESQLRRHIRQQLLHEGFFDSMKNKLGLGTKTTPTPTPTPPPTSSSTNLDLLSTKDRAIFSKKIALPSLQSIITQIFDTTQSKDSYKLYSAMRQYQSHQNQQQWIQDITTIVEPILSQNLTRFKDNPDFDLIFKDLLDVVIMQTSSSVKHSPLGLDHVIEKLKPDLIQQFDLLILELSRPANPLARTHIFSNDPHTRNHMAPLTPFRRRH